MNEEQSNLVGRIPTHVFTPIPEEKSCFFQILTTNNGESRLFLPCVVPDDKYGLLNRIMNYVKELNTSTVKKAALLSTVSYSYSPNGTYKKRNLDIFQLDGNFSVRDEVDGYVLATYKYVATTDVTDIDYRCYDNCIVINPNNGFSTSLKVVLGELKICVELQVPFNYL